MPEAGLSTFCAAFDQVCRSTLPPAALERTLLTDGSLQASELTLDTALVLEQAGPWGQGFEEPLFEGRFTVASTRLMGSEQQHVRYQLRAAEGAMVEAVDFGGAERAAVAGSAVALVFQLGCNRYMGNESVQLRVIELN